jgi:hypothetical protein
MDNRYFYAFVLLLFSRLFLKKLEMMPVFTDVLHIPNIRNVNEFAKAIEKK